MVILTVVLLSECLINLYYVKIHDFDPFLPAAIKVVLGFLYVDPPYGACARGPASFVRVAG